MKLNDEIAEKPEDLQALTFRKMKVLVRKEFKRLKKYTSKDDPTDCILLGKHDYPDKNDMILPVFGDWKWDFKEYAKKEVPKDRLGAIGTAYFDGIDEATNNMIIRIFLEKGKGKDDIEILERQFYKLVSKSDYTIILTEGEEEKEETPVEDEASIPETQAPKQPEVKTTGTVEEKLNKAVTKIEEEVRALVKGRSTNFSVDKTLSLDPLKQLVGLSRFFWKKIGEAPVEQKKALLEQIYATYGNLEKALYNYWVESATELASQEEFIKDVAGLFIEEFKGKDNTAHDDYGTGKELLSLARDHDVYGGVGEVEGVIKKLFGKYEKAEATAKSLEDLEQLGADIEALSKAGNQLGQLIKAHYKNGRLRDDLFDALEDWENTRIAMTEQIIPSLKNSYRTFGTTLTEATTMNDLEKASERLSSSVEAVERLLPKFMTMDRFREKLEKIDKEDQLSEDSAATKKQKEELLTFVKTKKTLTTNWRDKELKALAEKDKELFQSNEKLEAERSKLAVKVQKIRKIKEASKAQEWEAFWKTTEGEQQLLDPVFANVESALDDNLTKRSILDNAFNAAYKQFTAIAE